jgi:para-nitrobenzyl esterase
VFLYYFDQHPVREEGSLHADHGTPHGVDVPFVFKNLDKNNPNTTQSDLDVSEIMATYWTNFAKNGHPNGESVNEWPAFSNEIPVVMHLGPGASVGEVPDESSLMVLDAYFAWRRSPEGKEWAK